MTNRKVVRPKRPRRETKRFALLWVVILLFTPNLLLGALSGIYTLNRPWFNVDYALPMFLLVTGWLGWAAVAMAVIMLLDVVTTAMPVFFISGEAVTFDVVWQGVRLLRFSYVLCGVLLPLVLSTAAMIALSRLKLIPRRLKFSYLTIFGIVGFAGSFDALNGSSRWLGYDRLTVQANLSFSSLQRLVTRSLTKTNGGQMFTEIDTGQSATGLYLAHYRRLGLDENEIRHIGRLMFEGRSATGASTAPSRDLLMVMVESLGVLKADPRREQLFAPLLKLSDRYEMHDGSIATHGATISGEFREFGWVKIDHLDARASPPISIVKALEKIGYDTVSFHGFYESMFSRGKLYPELGFSRSIFLDQIQREQPDIPLQGILFRGAPDRDVAQLVARELRTTTTTNPKFVYWLTLSSHMPVDDVYAKELPFAACAATDQNLPMPIQAHERILATVVDSIHMMASDPQISNCDIVIVGDHPPPFSDQVSKGHYVTARVPYLLLLRKNQQ